MSCTFASINFSLIQWFSVSILEINKRKWLGLFDFLTHLFYRFLNKKEREKYISLLFRLWKIVTKITSCFDIVNQSFSFRYHPVSSCCSIKQFSLRRDHFLPPSCQPLSRRLHCSWHLLDDDISLLWSRGSFSRRERGWHSPRQPCSCKESRKRERERERENILALSCGVISRYCTGLWSRDTYNFPGWRYTLISHRATRVLMRGYGRCLPPSSRLPPCPAIPRAQIYRNHKAWWLVPVLVLLQPATPVTIDYFVVLSFLPSLSSLLFLCTPCPLIITPCETLIWRASRAH